MRNPSSIMPEESLREFLQLERRRAHRSSYSFALVAIRLIGSNFDPAIRLELIQCLRPVLREFDIFGTLGRSRFAVILPNLESSYLPGIVERILEKIREKLASLPNTRVDDFEVEAEAFPTRSSRLEALIKGLSTPEGRKVTRLQFPNESSPGIASDARPAPPAEGLVLSEYPLGLVARRAPDNMKSLEFKEEIKTQGGPTHRLWRVSGGEAHGLPTGGDLDFFVALLALWQEDGFREAVIPIRSIYQVLKMLELPINKKNYQRFHASLQTLAETSYHWEEGREQCETFRLFEAVHFPERPLEGAKASAASGRVQASQVLWRLVTGKTHKNLDLALYRRLPTPLARRLYHYLNPHADRGHAFSSPLRPLCLRLGFSAQAVERYKSSEFKRILSPALEALRREGFIGQYLFQAGTGEGSGVDIDFSLPDR